jgi:hypothetical protein
MSIRLQAFGALGIIVLLAGCGTPAVAATRTAPAPASPPSQTPKSVPSKTSAQPTGRPGMFQYFKTVPVTPAGTFQKASFARIGYMPGRDAMIVTFDAMLARPEGDCQNKGYAYSEYNLDMAETGNRGLINCYGGAMDTGGLFVGNDFCFAF